MKKIISTVTLLLFCIFTFAQKISYTEIIQNWNSGFTLGLDCGIVPSVMRSDMHGAAGPFMGFDLNIAGFDITMHFKSRKHGSTVEVGKWENEYRGELYQFGYRLPIVPK